MSGFTPGPWEVRTPAHDPNAFDVYGGGSAITRGYWAHNGKADARLIASAPDLLAACRMVADIAVGWLPITPGDITEVKAAIAKAEGRQEER